MTKYKFSFFKLILIIVVTFASVVALYLGYETKKYFQPEVCIHIVSVEKDSNKLQFATIAFNENSIWGENKEFEDRINAISSENNAVRMMLEEEYVFPGNISCTVVETQDGTYIEYNGYMTDKDDNTSTTIDKVIKVDVKIDEIVYE